MNKRRIIALLILLAIGTVAVTLSILSKPNYNKLLESYEPIYQLVKAEDFSTAKVKDNKVILYDDKLVEIKQIEIPQGFNGKLKFIQKRESDIVFWHSGFDDYDGIMFLDDAWTDENWNGIMRAEKLMGNRYVVYTYQ